MHWLNLFAKFSVTERRAGLAGFIEAKDDGDGGENWSYKTCKAPVRMSPPTNPTSNNLAPTFPT